MRCVEEALKRLSKYLKPTAEPTKETSELGEVKRWLSEKVRKQCHFDPSLSDEDNPKNQRLERKEE
ncbi:hypothetical protein COT40_00110 [Candidatus Peregrinibacteria bacterium CG08_land_8_20_14_0_20_41_10]|nr:MAG: hypothetical protein AUJ78_00970 [Candidatus Peregrinibacteria bacterium CG1_02_41_10]PIS32427.1 MAG: hypothetical protein COT40_00110 [Candidatus Peregrinibacteria bacterium CG08_land_8_20_14_0_20_41_10]